MGKPSKAVMEFMSTYKVDSDEIWEVHGSQWVVKHKALERIAAENGITWDRPAILQVDAVAKVASVCVFGKMGDRTEWATGEAAPYNNKNQYPIAMAEKRAKDRVILKLLNTHGAVYSDAEADDFSQTQNITSGAKRENPHVNRPEDFAEPTEYDAQGQPVDNIPLGDRDVTKLTKAQARKDFEAATTEMRACKSLTHLQLWASNNSNRVASYPPDWQEHMRGIFADHRNDLRKANGKVPEHA